MKPFLFDLETLPVPKYGLPEKIHCGVLLDLSSGEEYVYRPDEIDRIPQQLADEADVLVGHNISSFDVPVLEKHYPWFHDARPKKLFDTLHVSRQMYFPTAEERSYRARNFAAAEKGGSKYARDRAKEERIPKRLCKAFSLEAWGYRLRCQKGTFGKNPASFEFFSEDMLAYCRQDVRVNEKLYWYLTSVPAEEGWPLPDYEAMLLESEFAYWLAVQEQNGVAFDIEAAKDLEQRLVEIQERLGEKLRGQVAPWYAPDGKNSGLRVPKRTQSSRKIGPGQPGYKNVLAPKRGQKLGPVPMGSYTAIKRIEFNAGSPDHIRHMLKRDYDWQHDPDELTDSGLPAVDKDVLFALDYPIMPDLMEYRLVTKRLSQLAVGKEAWLRKVSPLGRIHGRVWACGTRTNRCSHSKPNLGQVPKNFKPYGRDCRSLFVATPGRVMVGADADRLQLMMLAHRLSLYDNGSFGEILRHGDAHEDWRQKCGLYIRENQKTLTYGWLFGAGDKKRGKIVIMDWRDGFEQGLTDQPAPNLDFAADLGRMANERLVKGVDGLEFLVEDIHEAHKYGYFYSLDGRVIHFGARHAALCDILQNDEAVVMRHALVRCANVLDEAGWRQPGDYAMLLNVHDEWQMETEPWCADALGQTMSESIAWAGRELGVRVPLTGDYAVGKNWSQTH